MSLKGFVLNGEDEFKETRGGWERIDCCKIEILTRITQNKTFIQQSILQ